MRKTWSVAPNSPFTGFATQATTTTRMSNLVTQVIVCVLQAAIVLTSQKVLQVSRRISRTFAMVNSLLDTIKVSYLRRLETALGRPPGSTNKTPRELRAEAKRLTEKAKYIEKLAALKAKKKK